VTAELIEMVQYCRIFIYISLWFASEQECPTAGITSSYDSYAPLDLDARSSRQLVDGLVLRERYPVASTSAGCPSSLIQHWTCLDGLRDAPPLLRNCLSPMKIFSTPAICLLLLPLPVTTEIPRPTARNSRRQSLLLPALDVCYYLLLRNVRS